MFTGIIEQKSKIINIENGKFTIENHFWDDIKLGQSIAHDWACMTIESFSETSYTFFVMQESMSKTNYGQKQIWDYFNIERCLKAQDRIDGHFVSWHIDTTGKISKLETVDDGSLIIWINFNNSFSKLTIEKWSIAINWVSLTIVDKSPWYISVSLIPLTQDWTNLWSVFIGTSVNLEFDMLGKYILNTQNDV